MKTICLAIVFAASCLAQPSVEKASVSGKVTSIAGEPLRRVSLRLTPPPPPRGSPIDTPGLYYATDTDLNGNFNFDEVASGHYMLDAERIGYLNAHYFNTRGSLLTITAGQRITEIVIKMAAQGIIAGKVVDDERQALPGLTVSVRLSSASGPWERVGVPGGTGTTDADGAFAVGGLIPGQYVVSVGAPRRTASPANSASLRSQQDAYVTTYYPDATDPGAATPVAVGPGAQVRGLEIQLQRVSIFKIKGRVVDAATGEAGSAEIVNLIRKGGGAPGLSAQSTGVRAGEFLFDGVMPGNYILETKATSESNLVGYQMISVGNEDLDRIVVEMKPAIELTGNLAIEGAPPSSWPQITLTPTEGLNYLDSPKIDVDGRFALTGLEPAHYRLTIGYMAPPLFVKSVRFNGQDLRGDIDLASSPTASLEIVVSNGTSSISGVVSDLDGPVGSEVAVIATRKNQGPYRATRTDENGRFLFTSLPSGEYLLIAGDIGPERLPPEFIEKLGKPLTLGEGVAAATELALTSGSDLRTVDLR